MPELRKIILPNGKPPVPGQLVRFPQLAATLECIGKEGREGFYAGPVAEAIATTLTSGGVTTTVADVGRQQSLWVEPLSVRYRGKFRRIILPSCRAAARVARR